MKNQIVLKGLYQILAVSENEEQSVYRDFVIEKIKINKIK